MSISVPEDLNHGKAGESRRSCTYHVASMPLTNSNDSSSYTAGQGPDGRNYEAWCGNDYDKNVVDPFDDYLHEAFRESRDSDRRTPMTDLVIAPEIRAQRAFMEQLKDELDGEEDDSKADMTVPVGSGKGKEVELAEISEYERTRRENRKALEASFGPGTSSVKGSVQSGTIQSPDLEKRKAKKCQPSKTQTQTSERRVSLRNKQNT